MSKPIASSRITTRYQISIPKKVRERMNAEIGDLILFFEHKGEIIMRTSVELPSKGGVSE